MEEYIENSDSKDNNKYGQINKKIMNYIYLILIKILIVIIIVFLFLYFSKTKKIKNFSINKNKNEIICDNGLFLPEDDKTKCIKCSIENCNECIGTKLNNICNKCKPGLNPVYENNKIISCSICNDGYLLINNECKMYSFKAKYKSNGGTIKLINSDNSKIKEMIVDGNQVSPSNSYLFNDSQDHEVFMLLDMEKYFNSIYRIFRNIDKMISISFSPFFNTSNINNMGYMFSGCTSLESINRSNFDTSNVTDMEGMFYNCYSITSIDLSSFITSNVACMESLFYNCYSIKSIDLSNFNTSNINNMGSMFRGCYSLTSINLSNFNTSKLDNMGYMFYNCSSLTSINLSNFDTSKVIEMFSLFYNCSSLTSIDLSNFITLNVLNMNKMFYGCSKLLFINILNFRSTSNNDLFDEYINSSVKIITNDEFKEKIIKNYINENNFYFNIIFL